MENTPSIVKKRDKRIKALIDLNDLASEYSYLQDHGWPETLVTCMLQEIPGILTLRSGTVFRFNTVDYVSKDWAYLNTELGRVEVRISEIVIIKFV